MARYSGLPFSTLQERLRVCVPAQQAWTLLEQRIGGGPAGAHHGRRTRRRRWGWRRCRRSPLRAPAAGCGPRPRGGGAGRRPLGVAPAPAPWLSCCARACVCGGGEEGGEQPEAESLSRRCRFAFLFLDGCNWMHGYFRRFLEASGEHGTEISSLWYLDRLCLRAAARHGTARHGNPNAATATATATWWRWPAGRARPGRWAAARICSRTKCNYIGKSMILYKLSRAC